MKELRLLRVIKCILAVLFPISLFLAIRWSDLPVLDMPHCLQSIFVKTKPVDSSMLNMVTGYASGYIVYILTVALPSAIKTIPMRAEAMKWLMGIHHRCLLTLALMYKNVCTKEDWESITCTKDIDLFDESYFERMELFDVTSEAETGLLHKETRSRLKWHEYLNYECQDMQTRLDTITLRFHSYLSEKVLTTIMEFRNSSFFVMFTGDTVDTQHVLDGVDGQKYFDSAPLTMLINEGNWPPIFSSANDVNKKMLRQYIDLLKALDRILRRYRKETIPRDRVLSMVRDSKVGHFGRARKAS